MLLSPATYERNTNFIERKGTFLRLEIDGYGNIM